VRGASRNAIAMSGATKMFVLKYNSLDNTKDCGNLSINKKEMPEAEMNAKKIELNPMSLNNQILKV
jgi:hypothetical protein